MTENAAPAAPVALAAVGGNLYRLVALAYQQRYSEDPTLPPSPIVYIDHERAREEMRGDHQRGPRPYRLIAIDLTALTGVDVTHETVRRWHRDWLVQEGADGSQADTDD
jgi:hypothetical protein